MKFLFVFHLILAFILVGLFSYFAPFALLFETESFLLPPFLLTCLKVVLVLGNGILFYLLTERFFPKLGPFLLGLFLVHPLTLEGIAFDFRLLELLGSFAWLGALFAAVEKRSLLWVHFCFLLSLLCFPTGWFLPVLFFFLPERPKFWWTTFGEIFLLFLGVKLGILPVSTFYWNSLADFYYLLVPMAPSFPHFSFATPGIAEWFCFGLFLLIGILARMNGKTKETFLPFTFVFLGTLLFGSFRFSILHYQGEAWFLTFGSSTLIVISFLWLVSSFFFRWGLKYQFFLGCAALFWVSFSVLNVFSFSKVEIWLEKRVAYTNNLTDWLHLIRFYENKANYDKAFETTKKAALLGFEVRKKQLQLLRQTHKTQESFLFAKQWSEKNPAALYPHQILGELLAEEGQWTEALPYFEIVEKNKKEATLFEANYFLRYGQTLFETKSITKAKENLEQAYLLSPEMTEVSLYLAKIYLAKQDPENALFFLRKGLFGTANTEMLQKQLLQGNGKIFFFKYVELLTQQKKLKKALTILREAQQYAPEEPAFLFYEATLLQTPPFFDYLRAEALYRKILVKNPDHQESARMLAELLFRRGRRYFEMNLLNFACRTFEEVLQLNEKHPQVKKSLSQVYRRQYEFFLKKKRPSRMIFFLEKGVQVEPTNSGLRLKLAEIYRRLKDYENAIFQYEAILEREPENTEAQNSISLILWKIGLELQVREPKKAKMVLEKFLKVAPKSMKEKKEQVVFLLIQLVFQLGETSLLQKQPEKAQEYFLAVLRLNENHGLANCRLAELYFEKKQKAAGLSLLKKGIPFLVDPAEASFYRGMLSSMEDK